MTARTLILTAALLSACAGQNSIAPVDLDLPDSAGDDDVADPVTPQRHSAARPTDRIAFGRDNDGAAPAMEDAAAFTAEASLEENCETTTDADGRIVVTCTYDDVVCVETYDAAGEFLSWDCGAWGSYLCSATEDGGHLCVFTDEAGATCTDTYDAAWAVVESTCGWVEEGEEPTEECATAEDGSMVCTSDDGYWLCTYGLDASQVMTSVVCESPDGSATCSGDAEVLTCAYDYVGYTACTETYSVEPEGYGLLSSDCDWDGDGASDCVATDGGGSACTYVDGDTVCVVGYDAAGEFATEDCTWTGGELHCQRNREVIECEQLEAGETCTATYDLAFELIDWACDGECPGCCASDDDCGGGACVAGVCEGPELVCPNPEDPAVHYLADAEACMVMRFACEEGQSPFSSECGCGCIDAASACADHGEEDCATVDGCAPAYVSMCDCDCADGPGCEECSASCFTFAACVEAEVTGGGDDGETPPAPVDDGRE